VKEQRPVDSLQSQAGRYLGVGMTWALSTALFLYLGSRADRWLGTRPWLTLIGAFVGAAAGFYYLFHSLTTDAEMQRKRRESEGRK
jgi:F0F1-type ATP synthase assembly protein I